MSESSVLREFLAVLGFKVDQASLTRFEKGLATATKRAVEFGAVVEGLAGLVDAMVVRVAASLDDLYWASQRIGAAGENIKAYEYSLGQLGGTARGARAALESVAMFIRSNPGAERWLGAIGVRTRDANGQLRDTERVMEDLGRRFAMMPQYMAVRYASMLGIDYQTLLAMQRGASGYAQQYRDFARSIGVDLASSDKASNRFMTSVRTLRMEIGLLVTKIGAELIAKWGPQLQRFLVWMGQHSGEVADRIRTWTERIARFGAALFGFAMRVLGFLERLDKATDGWSTGLIALMAVLWPLTSTLLPLLASALGPIGIAIVALVAAMGALYADFENWKAGGKSLIDWSPWAAQVDQLVKDVGKLGAALGDLSNTLSVRFSPAFSEAIKAALRWTDLQIQSLAHLARMMDAIIHGRWGEAAREGLAGIATNAASNPVAQGIEAAAQAGGHGGAPRPGAKFGTIQKMFEALGWTAAQAAGIAANLQRESGFDPHIIGDGGSAYGIAQWHPDRQADFKRLFGHDIRSSTLAEQVAFVNHELRRGKRMLAGRLLAAERLAGRSAAIVSMYYEGPKDRAGEAARRASLAEAGMATANLAPAAGGAGGVVVHSKTDIHVDGARDAPAVARDVYREHQRNANDIVRNAKGAVR